MKIKDMTREERNAYNRLHYRTRVAAIRSCPIAKARFDERNRANSAARLARMTDEERELHKKKARESEMRYRSKLKLDPERFALWRENNNKYAREYQRKRRHQLKLYGNKTNTKKDL